MAKILVADDNSNIQKMVGLVLKDQGIDVVAVGNGEAAVRKISDVRPDLVLADVFMPVRNGYEVCKFVKGDSSLSHIPVILLVGAFDPLDEEEAQRVGADGVLKKPFVPPDPLISMVKSALVRASTGNAGGSASKAGSKGAVNATVPSLDSGNAPTVAALAPQGVPEAESFVEEVPPKPPELKIDSGGQPLAFGNLMEPGTDTGDVSAYVNRPTMERDWGSGEEQEEEEEEDSSGAWRPDTTGVLAGEEESAAEKRARTKREAWTPTREKQQDLLEAGTEPELVTEVPAPKIPEPKTKAAELATPKPAQPPAVKVTEPATPKPAALKSGGSLTSAPTPAPPIPTPAPPIPTASRSPASPQKPLVEGPVHKTDSVVPVPPKPAPPSQKSTAPSLAQPQQSALQPPLPPPPMVETATPKEQEKPAGTGGAWFSISSSPWEASAQAPNPAPSWDTPSNPVSSQPIELTSPAPSAPAAPELESEPPATGFYTNNSRLPELVSGGEAISPATVETLRQEATQVIEESSLQRAQGASPGPAEKKAAALPPDVDDLVARVLAKLNPDALQAVTREILKPVVEAMVREELKTKKP